MTSGDFSSFAFVDRTQNPLSYKSGFFMTEENFNYPLI